MLQSLIISSDRYDQAEAITTYPPISVDSKLAIYGSASIQFLVSRSVNSKAMSSIKSSGTCGRRYSNAGSIRLNRMSILIINKL